MTTVVIMRSPCTMEDEGRHFFIKTCGTEEEAKEWIKAQEGKYYGPTDYYIVRSEHEPKE